MGDIDAERNDAFYGALRREIVMAKKPTELARVCAQLDQTEAMLAAHAAKLRQAHHCYARTRAALDVADAARRLVRVLEVYKHPAADEARETLMRNADMLYRRLVDELGVVAGYVPQFAPKED